MPPKIGLDWLFQRIADLLAFFTKNFIGLLRKNLFKLNPIIKDAKNAIIIIILSGIV
jgi:hypothetical protein